EVTVVASLFGDFAADSFFRVLAPIDRAAPATPSVWLLDVHRAMGDQQAAGVHGEEDTPSASGAEETRAIQRIPMLSVGVCLEEITNSHQASPMKSTACFVMRVASS